MPYAFMTFSTPQQTLAEVLQSARDYGYDGVEVRISDTQKHGISPALSAEERQAVRDQFADAGIDLCCLALSSKFSDPATVESQVEETRTMIDLAADLDCHRLRIFGGQIDGGLTREEAIAQVAKSLRELAPDAARREIILCLETHDDWCDPDHVAAIMEAVDHPAVAVNWDVMHPVRTAGWTMADSYQRLAPWIRHVHIHDGLLRKDKIVFMPIGEGELDHGEVLRLLKDAGYSEWISGEWIGWEPPEVHLPREREALRRLEAALR